MEQGVVALATTVGQVFLIYIYIQGGGSVKEKNEKQEHLFGIMLDLNSVMT